MSLTVAVGHYSFEWKGGAFEVEFRPDGVFWCKKFPAEASYAIEGDVLKIDWGKFGKYVLRSAGGNPGEPPAVLAGGVDGSTNPDDWRKATFVRSFTPQEALLSGSAWQLHFENGTPFRVEFHADGHFDSPSYPAHSWWKLDGDKVLVDWGKFGQYDFVIDVANKVLNGHLRGNEKSWRRLEYTEPMAAYQKKHHCGHDH